MHLQYYQEAEPIKAVRPFVRRIIYCDIPEPITLNVPAPPTGYNHIGWAMRGAGAKIMENGIHPVAEGEVHFAGQTVRNAAKIVLQGRVRHMLAELTPTALFSTFGLCAEPMANRVFSANLAGRSPLQTFLSRVPMETPMDEALELFQRALAMGSARQEVPRYISLAAGAIEESAGLAPLNDLVNGVSERQLQRSFKRVVGCTPKYFAQVLRMNATIVSLMERRGDTLATVAARHGFSDQSHMVRSVQAYFGHAPSEIRSNVDMLLRAFPTAGTHGGTAIEAAAS